MKTIGNFFIALVFALSLGCGGNREAVRIAELEKKNQELKTEIDKLRAEMQRTPAPKSSYLDDLERLVSLVNKGTLTPAEFEEQKKRLLNAAHPAPPTNEKVGASGISMSDLAEQLRVVNKLFQNGTITSFERDDKKKQYLSQPLYLVDLKMDLELANTLYQEAVISSFEKDELKKVLLQLEPPKK